MSICVLVATSSVVMAEARVGAEDGKVEAIEIYRAPDNKPVNAGTLIGGIAGAIGGALVGNEIEKKQGQATRYRITVRLDSGSSLILEDTHDLDLRAGDGLRIENGHIYRM